MDKTELEFIRKIYDKCDEENLYCSEDMQQALDEIRNMIKDKYHQVVEKIPVMILHCPNDNGITDYCEALDLFVCQECGWAGLYHETIKPYEINIKKT